MIGRLLGGAARGLLLLLGAYLIVRAVAEFFVIDPGDPESYRTDWGGPHYLGVLAVHVLPGVVAAVLLIVVWRRRRTSR